MTGEKQIREARYYNTNGKGVAIIAVITSDIDWAAYIGADNGYSEKACIWWAAEKGAKLSRVDAEHYFPDIELPYRS